MVIEHSCGHTTTADIVGPNTRGQRDRKAAWLAERPCLDCARAQRDEQHEQQARDAAQTVAANGWPSLSGSEKQVAWADQIRVGAVADMRERLNSRLSADVVETVLAYWTRAALRETDASWWIDHRDRTLPSINSLTLTAEERSTLADMTGANK